MAIGEINQASIAETRAVPRGTGPDLTITDANVVSPEIKSEEQRDDLKAVHQHVNGNGHHVKTIAEAQQESIGTVSSMLGDLRKFCNLVAAGLCLAAAVVVKILPEKSRLRKFTEDWAGHFARLAIGVIGGATGAVDAMRSGKPLLAGAQIGDAATSLIAPLKEMTNYRGLWIGAYNALPALETIHGKGVYANAKDYCLTNWKALTSTLVKIAKNPLGLLDPSQKGELGIISGLGMSACSALYMITGIKAFATARDAFGMTVEGEKIKPKHLAEGRGKYATSGYLMMAGSAATIRSKYAGKNTIFWSYLNLALNAVGKMFYLDALQANEPATIGKPITVKEMFIDNLKNLFSFGKETEKVLKDTQPTLVKMEDQPEALRAQVQVMQEAKSSMGSWSPSRTKSYVSTSRSGGGSGLVTSSAVAKPVVAKTPAAKVVPTPKAAPATKAAPAAKAASAAKTSTIRTSNPNTVARLNASTMSQTKRAMFNT